MIKKNQWRKNRNYESKIFKRKREKISRRKMRWKNYELVSWLIFCKWISRKIDFFLSLFIHFSKNKSLSHFIQTIGNKPSHPEQTSITLNWVTSSYSDHDFVFQYSISRLFFSRNATSPRICPFIVMHRKKTIPKSLE